MIKKVCYVLAICWVAMFLMMDSAHSSSIELSVTLDLTENMGGGCTLSYDSATTNVMGSAPGESINISNNPSMNYTHYEGSSLKLMESAVSSLNPFSVRMSGLLIASASTPFIPITQQAKSQAFVSMFYQDGSSPGWVGNGYAYDVSGSYYYTARLIPDGTSSFTDTTWKFMINSQTITVNLPPDGVECSGSGYVGFQFIGGGGYDGMFGVFTGGGGGWVSLSLEQSGKSAASTVPVPGTLWLLASGLFGLISVGKRRPA
jgi:hypothetical protein